MSAKRLVSKRWSLTVQALFIKGDGDVKCDNWVTNTFSLLPWESPGACSLAPDERVCSVQIL